MSNLKAISFHDIMMVNIDRIFIDYGKCFVPVIDLLRLNVELPKDGYFIKE